jgi:2-polyprenyl-6-hydroxyphenyl methylase / 3-demethylubiquinone-9 3-methyltransferase
VRGFFVESKKILADMNTAQVQQASLNVDPTEIDKFSELAHKWWDLDGEFRPLHQINPLRLDWIHSIQPLNNCRVLDVGCGGGILSQAMAALAAEVTGIDLALKSLKVAQLHAMEQQVMNVQYLEISAEDMASKHPAAYDVVTCLEMLEHVPDPASVVQACAQLVKPGGWVFFSTINRNVKSFAQAIVGAEYILGMVPRGTHHYEKFIRPSELAAWCRHSGLTLKHATGLSYNPITQAYRLGSDTGVNYLVAVQKMV